MTMPRACHLRVRTAASTPPLHPRAGCTSAGTSSRIARRAAFDAPIVDAGCCHCWVTGQRHELAVVHDDGGVVGHRPDAAVRADRALTVR